MDKPVLNLDQLTVESFTVADTTQDATAPGIIDTGCMSDCVSGCGMGGSFCW
jgi:hypothetical protein